MEAVLKTTLEKVSEEKTTSSKKRNRKVLKITAMMEGKAFYSAIGEVLYYNSSKAKFVQTYVGTVSERHVDINEVDLERFMMYHIPLSFEKIRRECTPGEFLFIDEEGFEYLYLGFTRSGNLVTDSSCGKKSVTQSEGEILKWSHQKINKKRGKTSSEDLKLLN